MQFSRRSHVTRYIDEVVEPAMHAMAAELRKQTLTAEVIRDERLQSARLEVTLSDAVDFEYEVRPQAYLRPAFSLSETSSADEDSKYFRAEVHLREGGQDYDIMGWSRDQVLGDILDQYEKHLHFLHVVRE